MDEFEKLLEGHGYHYIGAYKDYNRGDDVFVFSNGIEAQLRVPWGISRKEYVLFLGKHIESPEELEKMLIRAENSPLFTVQFGIEIETGIQPEDFFDDDDCYDEYGDYDEDLCIDNTEERFKDDVKDMGWTSYYDSSCGMEFPTKVYTGIDGLKEFYQQYSEFVDLLGRWGYDEYIMSPEHGAGGHFNLSFPGMRDLDKIEFYNKAKIYIPVLQYLLGHPYTCERDEGFRAVYESPTAYGITSTKGSAINFKKYAIEFRYLDSPIRLHASIVHYTVLIGLSLLIRDGRESKMMKRLDNPRFNAVISELWSDLISREDFDLDYWESEHGRNPYELLEELYSDMLKFLEPCIEQLGVEYGIDLYSALKYVHEHPMMKADGDIPDDVMQKTFSFLFY